jgi:hypothetical protein
LGEFLLFGRLFPWGIFKATTLYRTPQAVTIPLDHDARANFRQFKTYRSAKPKFFGDFFPTKKVMFLQKVPNSSGHPDAYQKFHRVDQEAVKEQILLPHFMH